MMRQVAFSSRLLLLIISVVVIVCVIDQSRGEEGSEGEGGGGGLESPLLPLGDSPTRRGRRFGDEVELDTWEE